MDNTVSGIVEQLYVSASYYNTDKNKMFIQLDGFLSPEEFEVLWAIIRKRIRREAAERLDQLPLRS